METKTMTDYEKELAERRERDAKAAKAALAKLREVARVLGWAIIPPKHKSEYALGWHDASADLTIGQEDRVIHLRANGYDNEGRVSVSGTYPRPEKGEASTYGLPNPSITCALTKTAQQIAADISRRFLPDYEAGLIDARKRNAEVLRYHDTRETALAVVLGRELTEKERESGRTYFEGCHLGSRQNEYQSPIRAEARADGDGEIKLELAGLPAALAAKIIALVRAEAA